MGSVAKRLRKANANYEAYKAGFSMTKNGRLMHAAAKGLIGMSDGLMALHDAPKVVTIE